eukprot:6206868-Pleurochrysis_carterae.AAC.1
MAIFAKTESDDAADDASTGGMGAVYGCGSILQRASPHTKFRAAGVAAHRALASTRRGRRARSSEIGSRAFWPRATY